MTFPNALSNFDAYATSFWVSAKYITSATPEGDGAVPQTP
jgi:hypothetical protein